MRPDWLIAEMEEEKVREFTMRLLGKPVTCSDCQYWDWYYNDLNNDDEEGNVIKDFGDCTAGHGKNISAGAIPVCVKDFKWKE